MSSSWSFVSFAGAAGCCLVRNAQPRNFLMKMNSAQGHDHEIDHLREECAVLDLLTAQWQKSWPSGRRSRA